MENLKTVPSTTKRSSRDPEGSTERQETVEGGEHRRPVEPSGILHCEKMTEGKREWPNPFEDGHAAERIVKILEEKLSQESRAPARWRFALPSYQGPADRHSIDGCNLNRSTWRLLLPSLLQSFLM
jgi:hypothetical protein